MLFKYISYLSSGGHFVRQSWTFEQFLKRQYEEPICEIILNLDQWFRRKCRLKYFLSTALAALLFTGAEPFG